MGVARWLDQRSRWVLALWAMKQCNRHSLLKLRAVRQGSVYPARWEAELRQLRPQLGLQLELFDNVEAEAEAGAEVGTDGKE